MRESLRDRRGQRPRGPARATRPPVGGSFGPPGVRRPSAPLGIGRRTPTRAICDGQLRPRQAPSKRHPGSLFQPALSAFQPIASHATRPRRRRRRRPTRATSHARATGTAPRAATSSAVSATSSPARLASVPAWPRRRRLLRTRPRTRAASRAQKTRTVTGTAASSGTRALSAAPVAPATVPSGTRRPKHSPFPPRARPDLSPPTFE